MQVGCQCLLAVDRCLKAAVRTAFNDLAAAGTVRVDVIAVNNCISLEIAVAVKIVILTADLDPCVLGRLTVQIIRPVSGCCCSPTVGRSCRHKNEFLPFRIILSLHTDIGIVREASVLDREDCASGRLDIITAVSVTCRNKSPLLCRSGTLAVLDCIRPVGSLGPVGIKDLAGFNIGNIIRSVRIGDQIEFLAAEPLT